MKAVVAAFNQEKALVEAFSVIVQPVVDRFAALVLIFFADLVSDVTTVVIPVSGPYLLYLGCDVANMSGAVYLKLNKREQLMVPGRCDIVEMDEDDVLQV